MRQGNTYVVESETGTMIHEIVAEDLADAIENGWKAEYGERLDFGGGVYGITCYSLLELCSENPSKLKKLFPVLTMTDAKGVVTLCKEAVRRDI